MFDLEKEYQDLYVACKKDGCFDLGRMILDKLLVIQQLNGRFPQRKEEDD